MALTTEEEAMFAELNVMFDTPGWAHLTNGWKQEMEQLPQAMFFNAKSAEQLDAARVRYGLLHELVNLPEALRAQREQLIEDSENVQANLL